MSSRSYYVGVQFWPSYHDDDLDDNDGDDDDKWQVHSQPHQVDISWHQWHKGSQFFSSPNLPTDKSSQLEEHKEESKEVGVYLTRCARIAASIPLIWPNGHLCRCRAALAAKKESKTKTKFLRQRCRSSERSTTFQHYYKHCHHQQYNFQN